jgi:hypothetical protein
MQILVDMSAQPAGEMFAAGTDWFYECERAHVSDVLEAFRKLGIPAAVLEGPEKKAKRTFA